MRWWTTTARSKPRSAPRSPRAHDAVPAISSPVARLSSAGGCQCRVVGPLDDADPLEREVAQPRASQDELLVDRTEDAGVLARGPVVAHDEILLLAHDPGER